MFLHILRRCNPARVAELELVGAVCSWLIPFRSFLNCTLKLTICSHPVQKILIAFALHGPIRSTIRTQLGLIKSPLFFSAVPLDSAHFRYIPREIKYE